MKYNAIHYGTVPGVNYDNDPPDMAIESNGDDVATRYGDQPALSYAGINVNRPELPLDDPNGGYVPRTNQYSSTYIRPINNPPPLTSQGGNSELAGRTVSTTDGYQVSYSSSGYANQAIAPDGSVTNYDSLGNQIEAG